ncbi:MAG TPA: di-heme oxidoredictase family protein [Vicinamibacterales bacterium]|nr:di-heme oxidoredictase family protein [Vicinamibacterales bacterium]
MVRIGALRSLGVRGVPSTDTRDFAGRRRVGPREIPAYTDLLLHDMGPALSDGIREGDASPREFRTPPLWGISRTGPPYLHDGRARTIHEAIVAHDGEAARAAAAYKNLPTIDRQALLRFVESR